MGTVKYTGPVASFHCPTNAEIRSLKVHFSPKQEGTGDPSPSNVRPISGWTGVNVYHTGKNLLNIGSTTFSVYKQYKLDTPLAPATYTVSAFITTTDTDYDKCSIMFQHDTGNLYIRLNRNSRDATTFTLPSKCSIVYLYASTAYSSSSGDTATWQDIQLEVGSIATPYEPYTGSTTNYEFGVLVYGGWVDLISGEAASTYTHCKIKDLPGEWNYRSGNNRFQITLTSNFMKNDEGWTNCAISEKYKTSISQGYGNKQIATYINKHIYIRDDDFEGNIESFLENVGDSYISYELAEPTYYNLTSTQLQTFLGQNNVWSNADYVEIEYDLHETQDILNRKAFIIANQPHIVTTTPAGIANFSTDLIAPLKSCKVAFSPVQSGSGDPSPDNVRPISGWTGCNVVRTGKNIVDLGTQSFTRYKYIDLSYSIKAGKYKLSATITSTDTDAPTCLIGFWDKDGGSQIATYALYRNARATANITLSKDCKRIYLYASNGYAPSAGDTATWQDIQLEVGSTATAYEPYTGSTIPLDWTTEAGTVYGGYVDLVSGEVWKERQIIEIKTAGKYGTWDSTTGKGAFWYTTGSSLQSTNDGVLCERLSLENNVSVETSINGISWYANGIVRWIELGTMEMTSNEYNAYLAENPLRATYRLRTPQLVTTLTPTQLKSLRGVNNIWSDANGDTTVKYWAH